MPSNNREISSKTHDKNGKFAKGNVANPKGKKRGTVNTVTRLTREWISELLDGQTGKIESELGKLDGALYIRAIMELVSYIIPKAQPVQTQTAIDVDELHAKWMKARSEA